MLKILACLCLTLVRSRYTERDVTSMSGVIKSRFRGESLPKGLPQWTAALNDFMNGHCFPSRRHGNSCYRSNKCTHSQFQAMGYRIPFRVYFCRSPWRVEINFDRFLSRLRINYQDHRGYIPIHGSSNVHGTPFRGKVSVDGNVRYDCSSPLRSGTYELRARLELKYLSLCKRGWWFRSCWRCKDCRTVKSSSGRFGRGPRRC